MKAARKMSLLTMVAAFLVISLRTAAAEPLYVYLGEIRAENNILYMQVGNSLTTQQEAISYKVTLGDEELKIVDVSSYNEMNLHTSYIYLVDISGSIKVTDMEAIREILRSLIDGLKQEDNACIMLVGNDTYTDGVFLHRDDLLESVETIEGLHEDTNLYYAINRALNLLTTSDQALERKCLVILSDGQDDRMAGITQAEVEQKILETNIPICSVALGKNAGEDTAKVMGSFARSSPGGIHMVYGSDDLDAEAVAENIKQVAEDVVVLQADISGYVSNGTESYLRVELHAEGTGTAVDGYNVKSVVISRGVLTSTEAPQETDVPDTGENEENQTVESAKGALVIVAVVLLAVCALIGLLIFKRHQKKMSLQTGLFPAEEISKASQDLHIQPGNTSEPEKIAVPTMNIILTKVGMIEEESIEIEIKGELVIGRKDDVADLAFPGDMQLSSRHCRFLYDGEILLLEDLNSLNGTFVNGIPIKEPYALQPDDKIYIGSMEWRIHW